MKNGREFRLALLVATLTLGTVACGPDDKVAGPALVNCVGDACSADACTTADCLSEPDASPDAIERSLGFSIDTANGPALEGGVTGAQISFDDDKYPGPADPGVQIDVVVASVGLDDGTPVELLLDGAATGAKATISKGSARIEKATIPCSPVPLSIAVRATPAQGTLLETSKNLQLMCQEGGCTATLETPPGCLVADVDPGTPGFQYTFIVKTTTLDCTHAFITYQDVKGKAAQSEKVALNGAASAPVKVTLAPDDKGLIAQAAKLQAVVEDQAHPERQAGVSSQVSVGITTDAPTINIQQPLPGQLTFKDDTDDQKPGIQVTLVGTATTLTPNDTGAIQISVDGVALPPATLLVDDTFKVDLDFPQSKTYTVKITAKNNNCELESSKTVPYSVYASKADMVVLEPAPGQVLLAKNDLNPATPLAYETHVVVGTQQATQGSEVSVFCRTAGPGNSYSGIPLGTATYADPTAPSLPVPVTLDQEIFGHDVTCYAQDNAPNPAKTLEVTFQIGLPAPCLTIVLPVGSAMTNTPSLDIAVAAKNLEGVQVDARITAQNGTVYGPTPFGKKVAKDSVVAKLPLAFGLPPEPLPDGVYTVALEATDSWGNLASESTCSEVQRTITLDTQGPVLAITLPAKATLTDADDPDVDAVKPGYQTDVEVTTADAVSVCLLVNTVSAGCKPVGAGQNKVTFQGISLQPGANALQPTGTDLAGNTAAPAATIVQYAFDGPVVTFVSPVASLTIADDKLAVEAEVSNAVDGSLLTGATTEVWVNGALDAAIQAKETQPGHYTFTLGSLAAGDTTIQFGAAAPGLPEKKGYSPALVVTRKIEKPSLSITAPLDGALFNLANKACVASAPDCLTDVDVALVNVEDGSNVLLTVNCQGKPAELTAPAQSGLASFSVTLVDQKKCQLAASVTDAAGQKASAAPVEVTVDRTAPVFGDLASPQKPGTQITLLATNDANGDPSDGIQVNLQIAAAGFPKDAKVQVDIFDDSGKKVSYPALDVPLLPDDKVGVLSFGVVTVPDGFKVKLVFTGADAAGNPAGKIIVAQVLSAKPEVRIAYPIAAPTKACSVQPDCGAGLACVSGKCVNAWSKLSAKTFSIAVFGIPAGAALRVCSDSPGVTGDACATAGYKVLAQGTSQATGGTLSLASLPDGTYHLIAEASFLPGVPWTSSLSSPTSGAVDRTLLIDTVAPQITAISAPGPTGANTACLSDKLQSVPDLGLPGGKFAFSIAMQDEDATVTLMAGSAKSVGATQNKAVTLAIALPEGNALISAAAVDIVGNVGELKTLAPVVVDTLAPVGGFSSPAKAKVLAGDALDVIVVSTAKDVDGQDVVVKDGGVSKATLPFTGSQAVFAHATYGILSEGSHQLTADLHDACGNTMLIASIPSQVMVDTEPPTIAIASPLQGAVFTDNQDAAPATSGYQVEAEFGTIGATTWSLDLGWDCDDAFANCPTYLPVGGGAVKNPGANEPKLLVTIPFGSTVNYSLRLTTQDTNGNKTIVQRGFQVKLSGCLVQVKGLPTSGGFNTQACAAKGQDCASVSVPLTAEFVGPCGAVSSIDLLKNGSKIAGKAPQGTSAAFELAVNDGDNFDLEVAIVAGAEQKGSSGALKIKADLSNPVLAFVAGEVASEAAVVGGLLGKSKDLAAAPGHQVHLVLDVKDAGLAGGSLTQLTRTVGGASADLPQDGLKLPLGFDTAVAQIAVQFATLAEDATNTVVAKVTDALGNVGEAQATITVDWTPPAAVVLDALGAGDLNPRRPMATLRFNAVGDNGVTGTAASYEVRYSRKPIANETAYLAACDAKSLPLAVVPTPSAAGTDEQVTIEGPDPRPASDPCKFAPLVDNGLTKYYFAVRVVDAAGNLSPVSAAVSTDALRLRFAKIGSKDAAYSLEAHRLRIVGVGDLNADGLGDLAIGGGADIDLCIVYGRKAGADGSFTADIDFTGASSAKHICLPGKNAQGAGEGLGGIATPPADVNGDGIVDLVIGAGTGSKVPRDLRVYLGRKDEPIAATPAVVVKNIANQGSFGVRAPTTIGNFNGDTSATGLAISDIAVHSAPAGSFTYDRVFVIPGSAAWAAGKQSVIDLDSANDRKNNNIASIHLSDGSGTPFFGQAVLGLGNVLQDSGATQFDDLAISQFAALQQIHVVRGRAYAGELEMPLSVMQNGVAAEDANSVRIRIDATTGANSFAGGMAAVEFDGKPGTDLAVRHQATTKAPGALYWIRGADLGPLVGKAVTLTLAPVANEPTLFSHAVGHVALEWVSGPVALGNFADHKDGSLSDVVFATPYYAPQNSTQVKVRLATPRPALDGQAGYAYDDLVIGDPFSPGAGGWGNASTGSQAFAGTGDFNGDGRPDFAVGAADKISGGQTTPGYLVLVY